MARPVLPRCLDQFDRRWTATGQGRQQTEEPAAPVAVELELAPAPRRCRCWSRRICSSACASRNAFHDNLIQPVSITCPIPLADDVWQPLDSVVDVDFDTLVLNHKG